jgi:predicted ester cyclase
METPLPKLIHTFREFATEVRTTFPDARIEVEEMIAEGDKETARMAMSRTQSGTHQGQFQGIAPTGKRVPVRVMDIFRIAKDKIVEHWGHGGNPADILREPKRP